MARRVSTLSVWLILLGEPHTLSRRRDPTPTNDKSADKPLPLQSESPAPRAQDDITPKQQQYLHTLIPALGVSTPKAIQSNAFHHATSPPDHLRKQASLAAAAAAPVPGSPSSTVNSGPVKSSGGGTPSVLGRYYLSASDPQHISKQPHGSISFPDPSAAQYQPVIPQLSPLLKNRGAMMGNPEASPTLSIASDETFIPSGTSPKTGSTIPANQSMFPPMNKVPSSGFGSAQAKQQQRSNPPPNVNAFASYPINTSPSGGETTRAPTLTQIHQSFAGMPSGPLGSGQQPPRINPDGTPMSPDVGSSSAFGSASRSAPVGGANQQQRPLLRQTTADSFMSTSSEEEDLSSPMILPDTSLRASDRPTQQPGKESPRFGNGAPGTPRGIMSGGVGKSPRMAGGVGAVSGGNTGAPLFPPMSSVTKVRAGHPGGAGPASSSKFTFTNPSGAPVFPPMSPSSSSSGESGDEGTAGIPRSGRRSGWRFRSKSPFISAQNSQATTDGTDDGEAEPADSESGNGDDKANGDENQTEKEKEAAEWERYRAVSITVGGMGYGKGGSGDEESDEDEERKKRRAEKSDRKLETNTPLTAGGRKKQEDVDRKIVTVKEAHLNDFDDEDEDDDEEDGESLESEDGYQDATGGTSGPFPGGKAVRPPAKRKHPNVKSLQGTDRDDSALEEGTTVTRTKKDGTVVRKKRKSAPAEEGDVFCDYVEPLPVSLRQRPQLCYAVSNLRSFA